MDLRGNYETLKGEQLKASMELSLNLLGALALGRFAIETYAFGLSGRIVDSRLQAQIVGINLENPLIMAAGWDKKGKAIRGLYHLGFAGSELGTVPEFGQPGNEQPRLWTIDDAHSVGLNRLGFNAQGAEMVQRNVSKHQMIPGVLGVNVGKNKELANDHSPEYHAKVVSRFNEVADYFVFNPSSPNTKDLRELQMKDPMRDHMQAIRAATEKPVLVKYAPDMSLNDFDDSVGVVIEEGGNGLVLTNTTINQEIKAKYGVRWANEAGGISGDDPDFRRMSTAMVKHAYEEYGDQLDIFGVGGVKDHTTALEKIRAGASAVQILTAIRPSRGRVAAETLRGLVEFMDKEGVSSIQDLVGVDSKRGVKPKAA